MCHAPPAPKHEIHPPGGGMLYRAVQHDASCGIETPTRVWTSANSNQLGPPRARCCNNRPVCAATGTVPKHETVSTVHLFLPVLMLRCRQHCHSSRSMIHFYSQ